MTAPRRRRRGALLALAGVALPLVLAGCSSVNVSRNVSVFDLHPGQCVVPPTTVKASLATLEVVPCHEPHTQEVYALTKDPGSGNYPGTPALRTFADASCLEEFEGYVGVDYRDSSLFYTYLLPSVRSWAANDRTVVCLVTTTGQKLTKSVKGSKL